MPADAPVYRFRGSIRPCAEVKRPVRAYRAADGPADGNGKKSTSATIDIFDVIDSWGGYWGISAAEVDQALANVGKVDTLYVRVNSPGGEATEGVAIANLLRAHAAEVRVTNYGLAASAASLIAVAGKSLSMAPGSLLMIHEAWNMIRGNASDLRSEADVLDKINDSYAGVYALKGGTDTDWRALMAAETWFTPADAVEIGLADQVGIEAAPLPDAIEAADPLPTGDDETPFDRAARIFDLSVFAHTPAAFSGTRSPAEPPVHVPTQPEEAVTMTPEDMKALRERLGLADDADITFAVVDARLTELEEAATAPPAEAEVTDEVIAAHFGVDADTVKAAVDAAKNGKVTVSQSYLDALNAKAEAGVKALERQDREDRDETIAAAQAAGKIGRDEKTVASWQRDWSRDPEATKAELDSLPARFPVGALSGVPGSDLTDGDAAVFTDDEATAVAQLVGVSKEGLLR